ncbi:MAG: hypothetical protein COA99_16790 [Moraxellaceae bacterium]|nr:MAG: hypothetical protein COA99_16790 [Moraxellaceae bacterium]
MTKNAITKKVLKPTNVLRPNKNRGKDQNCMFYVQSQHWLNFLIRQCFLALHHSLVFLLRASDQTT